MLSDYIGKDNSTTWDKTRRHVDEVKDIYANTDNEKFKRYAERMQSCTDFLVLGQALDKETGEANYKLKTANFCRVRHCPVCQWRRTKKWQAKFFQALPTLQQHQSNLIWLFLTLTVRNCKIIDLGDTLTEMNNAFKRLVRLKRFKNLVQGWIKSTEVTHSQHELDTHPHYHVLLLTTTSNMSNHYLNFDEFRQMWCDCLRSDYLPSVNIKRIKGDLHKGALEVLKYAVKPDDMIGNSNWFLELTKQLFKRRFIATGGTLKNVLKEYERTNDELVNAENTESEIEQMKANSLNELVFNWNTKRGKYLRATSK